METDLGNVSPNPKGTYDNTTEYEYLDLVEYQGGSYLCIAALGTKITGTAPTPGKNTDIWQTVALPGNATKEYLDKHADVIEKAKQVETSRAAVELCKQEVESAQADVEQMRQETQQAAQNASDANAEAQQAVQQAEASRSAAQTSEQNAAASRDLANTYKEAAETAKSVAETAAQNASESKTAAETAAQEAAQSKADIDSIKAGIEEAAKGENVSQIQKNMNDIGLLKESLNSVTDTVFSEKKYASLKYVEETKKVNNTGKFEKNGRANVYIVNTYIGQTLKAKGYGGGITPLIVFFDHNDKLVSYIDPNMPWNDNVYQDVVVPEGAYKAYVNDNDGDRIIDLQGLQFEKYNIKQELERLEGLIPDSSKISYDLEQAQLQMAKTQRMNDFAYSKFDKAYFVLTIDDANKYLPDVYDLCHELGVPLCPAIIVGNLNTDYKNDGRTIKDICDLVVADGGEILAHSGKYITKESTEEDYADVFRMPKIELEKLGYDIRGIITAGGVGYLSNDIRLDNWSRKYYDYSDQNGISSSKAYYHPRWWYHDYTMDGAKNFVDNAIKTKSFIVVAMHGSDSTSELEHINNLRELLEYMIAKGTDNLEITTWAKVYDKFKSTKLEERIKVLETS